jgi:hypothetical protein
MRFELDQALIGRIATYAQLRNCGPGTYSTPPLVDD